MAEWKRVFFSPGRLGFLALLTILGCALFMGTLMQQIGPGEFRRALELGKYKGELTEKWREEEPSKILALSEAEESLLMDYYYYTNGYTRWDSEGNELPPAFSSQEEADQAIVHMEYLLSLKEDEMMFSETLWMYIDALHEVEADAEYIAGYDEYLQKIQKQAEEQSKTSIFGKKNSFSMRNLRKTAKEFGKLLGKEDGISAEEADPETGEGINPGTRDKEGQGSGSRIGAVQVSFGNNTGIEKWLQYTLGDYFGLLFLIIIVMSFLEERKKGLWSMIRTTKGGRMMLGIHRVGILLAASAGVTLLLNFLPLFLSFRLNGGHTDLSRAIQSVQSFRTCTIRTTIGGWLARYFFMKTLSGLFLGLFIWFIMGSVQNSQLSLAALLPVLGGEYALFTFLPVQSVFNLFKYLNLFSYVHTTRLYTNYLNINLFSFPVGNRRMMFGLLPVLLAGFLFLCVRMQAKRYPEGNRDLLSKIALRVNKVLDILRSRFTAGIWEAYKVLILQYGIVMMLIMLIASRSLNFAVWAPIPEDKRTYYMYVRDMQGPIDESTDEYLKRARESAEKSGNPYELTAALDMLEETVHALREKGEKEGFDPWMLYDQDFNAFYGETPKNRQRLNAMIAMLFVVFLCAGITSYEKQAGVVPMLRSLRNGRRKLLLRKVMMALILSAFAWGCVYLREAHQFTELFLPKTGSAGEETVMREFLSAPIKNLDNYADFPFNVSIRGFLILLNTMRLLMLFSLSFAVLYISSFLPNVRMAYLVNTAVLILPALFTVLGIGFFKWISPLIPVSAAELLLLLGEGKTAAVIPWLVLTAAGLGSLILHKRKWV